MSLDTNQKKPLDGRLLAVENEEAVLIAVYQFSWLATRQLAALVWPDAASPRVAQRTLSRLRDAGEVLWKKGADGATVYALSAAGARRVERVYGETALISREPLRYIERQYQHRCLANDIAIWWLTQQRHRGGFVDTEHEIQRRKATINSKDAHFASASGKIPDALLHVPVPAGVPDSDYWSVWVEAECGHKNLGKQEHMVAELAYILGRYGTQMTERRRGRDGIVRTYTVVEAFVVCPTVGHEERLARTLLAFLRKPSVMNDYDTAYIRKHVVVWRPDGTVEAIEDLVTRMPGLVAYDRQLVKRA
ncbi:replication-relaxation family protein [Caballeronia sp. LZ033]|uniref:replication-relaxation family protein n=1 Tax=Caballeronia sp. LZ033 TaxID=3038566 RepID=UPI002862F622|nr:replication-relaxation family protein [Caballeronia sp. LZ033]MDR5813851.1 replication-relaxation family protein [Caballeronia sp. LZ033]